MTMHLAIIRVAALLVPSSQRAEWFAEWTSELWYVRQSSQEKVTAFCLGAFQDAIWLRRNRPFPTAHNVFCLQSPFQCTLFLAVLAAVSAFFALRLPGLRDKILPSPYPDAHNLAMVSIDRLVAAPLPTIPIEVYQSLTNRAQHIFTGLAFYQPILTPVSTGRGPSADLSVAVASRNLFELLEVPISSIARPPGERQRTATLILSQAAWRKYFDGDRHIVGRVIEVAGQPALIAGVISGDLWRLPGKMDAWLLEDEQSLAALPPHSKGFVLAHLKAYRFNRPRNWQWRISVPNEQGDSDAFNCALLAEGQPILAHLLMILIALLILPTTTFLGLGEYPANRHSPPLATRLRRWIFMAFKIALLMPIVFCGSLDLGSLIAMQIQPHAMLVGYVLAFRWALVDQRKRCPVCLRLLTSPARIGTRSQTFLEWYGTELVCGKGHGLLHVTEIPTSCYSPQRWQYLDPSWSSLFP